MCDFLIGCVLCLFFGFILGMFTQWETDDKIQGAINAISECQKSLPRDQVCEAVITARVVEDK